MDYKDWIRKKAEEIAWDKFKQEFYSLGMETQTIIFNTACEACKDYVVGKVDELREKRKQLLIEKYLVNGGK